MSDRLAELYALRDRVDAAIAREERARRATYDKRAAVLLARVAPSEIREWARRNGISVPHRGRVPAYATNAYLRAVLNGPMSHLQKGTTCPQQ